MSDCGHCNLCRIEQPAYNFKIQKQVPATIVRARAFDTRAAEL